MERFDGYLFSKLANIDSKSEGPEYILQYFDYTESVVKKQVELWQEDPQLHPYLNKKVTIDGKLSQEGIMYMDIYDYKKE